MDPETNRFRSEIGDVADLAGGEIRDIARTVDVGDVDRWWQRQSPRIGRISSQGFSVTASAGARYVAAHAAGAGVAVEPVAAELTAQALEQIATALTVSGPVAFKKNMARSGDPLQAARVMTTGLAGTSRRLVMAGARRTVMDTVRKVPTIVGFRRVTAAGACDFCEMLAGRGAVYKTNNAAAFVVGRGGRPRGSRRIGQSYHDHCRCTIEPIYDTVVAIPPGPVTLPRPAPPLIEPVEVDELGGLMAARSDFRSIPRPRVDESTIRPSLDVQRREAARLAVGREADDIINRRISAAGGQTSGRPEARKAVDDARAKLVDAKSQFDLDPSPANRRVLDSAVSDLVTADSAFRKLHRDYAIGWRREMGKLLDEAGVERGGVPVDSVISNADRLGSAERQRIQEAIDLWPRSWMGHLTGPDRYEVVSEGTRAWHRPGTLNLPPGTPVDTVAHELGHAVEVLVDEVQEVEWAFYWRRVGDEPLQSLRSLTGANFEPSETTRPDEFPHPYMGKDYGANARSHYELLSMASEAFLSDRTDDFVSKAFADDDTRQWFLSMLLTG